MITFLSITIFSILLLIALIHIVWALGSYWPAKDEQSLINTVIGSAKRSVMPAPFLIILVAIGIFGAGLCVLWGPELISLPFPEWIKQTSLISLIIIFAARGISTYLFVAPLVNRTEPFKTLDRQYFAPLCLLLSLGFYFIHSQS